MSGTTRRTDEGRGRLGSTLSGLAVALGCVLFLGGFVWGAIVYQPYTVPTDSMSPTITSGDRILAERIDGSEIKRGDVVVFREETWGNAPMVKRVVAVGGDTVACCTDGKLTVNGEKIDEAYLPQGEDAELSGIPEITVPKGRLFLLGDERSGSLDSTAHLTEAGQGTVPRANVDARVDAVVWPMDGMLARPTGFEKLGALSSPGPLRLITAALLVGMVLVLGGAAYGPIAKRLGGRPQQQKPEPAGVG
ncbi:signal peptidase I [Streptomyces ipomoeae]|jgi:signal peptidase I|uniref:Signal peptidase I n=2 Tax=Streptomyces ipomoeae TaxID=103232 RepID=L1KHG7_9ACTN|nr:signal peptidase I [Streptomyces ipomoeae]EKX59999.1 signal peptidase I [Streptomyces ipomoeae 91-03]MDX2696694.1 signal peptidase I [Streptomyces ipomoeae]MDX2823061.1 signal peptidase I [Streptomyces ipomoeae]MDX2842453.1 signal peptidase I [Streptomyces ipomoeae]MDX2875757.1 signal peptidase I [Streptomyces ipomoeae]